MIDTVALTIYNKDYQFIKKRRYKVEVGSSFTRCIYNPTKKEIKEYGYLPRLTEYNAVRKGGYVTYLRIEFSIPKLLYSNNFDEVDASDFEEICSRIKVALFRMGVIVRNTTIIENSEVSAIHYSKNIVLAGYTEPYPILRELGKIDLNKHYNLNKTDYRNEGHAVRYHSNNFEVVFYDKRKDLLQARKSEKKSLEKDSYTQLNLLDNVRDKKPFEVLRMEVRIGNRKKMKQILRKYGLVKTDRTFKSMFKLPVSKRILVSFLKEILDAYPKMLTVQEDTQEDLLINIKMNNPKIRMRKVLELVGLKAILSEVGVRKYREISQMFGEEKEHWYRLKKETNALNLENTKNPLDSLSDSMDRFERV
ncbi:MAG: hypothetical protein ABIA11_03915 [Patescibacteria group bacterium]